MERQRHNTIDRASSSAHDTKPVLARLRKLFVKLTRAAGRRAGTEDGGRSLTNLSNILACTRLVRLNRLGMAVPGTDARLTAADLARLTETQLEELLVDSHAWLCARVPSGRMPAPSGGSLKTLISTISTDVGLLDRFDERISGYLYQFFCQDDRRRAQKSITTADKHTSLQDLIAFTQIYTPGAVVNFLLSSCLSDDRTTASNSAPGSSIARALAQPTERTLRSLKLLDPACGTGHFLIAAFERLMHMYEAAGAPDEEAARAIVTNNLHGADIDATALWICGTELLLKARRYTGGDLMPLLTNVENTGNRADIGAEHLIHGCGSLRREWPAEHLLSQKFDVIVTNPPYLGRRLLDRRLKQWLKVHYRESCHDLSTAFLERSLELLAPGGRLAFITQASLLYLPSYSAFRKRMLERYRVSSIVELGAGAFPGVSGEKINSVLITLENCKAADDHQIEFCDLRQDKDKLAAVSQIGTPESTHPVIRRVQSEFLQLEKHAISYRFPPFIFSLLKRTERLDTVCDIKQGLATSDNARFLRYWWDVPRDQIGCRWQPYVKGAGQERWWAPVDTVIDWGHEGERVKQAVADAYPYLRGKTSWVVKNEQYYFKPGISFSFVNTGCLAARLLHSGCIFDVAGSSIFTDEQWRYALLAWLNSSFIGLCAEVINPTFNMQVGDVRRLPAPNRCLPSLDELGRQAYRTKRACSNKIHLDLFSNCFPERQYPEPAPFAADDTVDYIARSRRKLEDIEQQIDEIVLREVSSGFHLDKADTDALIALCTSYAERRRKQEYKHFSSKAVLAGEGIVESIMSGRPFALVDLTTEFGDGQLSRLLDGLRNHAGEDPVAYLQHKFTSEHAAAYRGIPRLIVLPTEDKTLALVCVPALRAALAGGNRELIAELEAIWPESKRRSEVPKALEKENWSGADLLCLLN